MKYYKKLIGKHIYLSPMTLEDIVQYVKWMNDLSITEKLGTATLNVSIESELEWLKTNSSTYQFAIVDLKTDELIGNCGIQQINSIRQCAEIGLFIGEEKNRNQGYGAEVIGLLLDYGFDYLNLHNVMLRVYSFNEQAINCYQKVGFQEIGRRRESYYLKGTYYDEIFMDIIREEWNSLKK